MAAQLALVLLQGARRKSEHIAHRVKQSFMHYITILMQSALGFESHTRTEHTSG